MTQIHRNTVFTFYGTNEKCTNAIKSISRYVRPHMKNFSKYWILSMLAVIILHLIKNTKKFLSKF